MRVRADFILTKGGTHPYKKSVTGFGEIWSTGLSIDEPLSLIGVLRVCALPVVEEFSSEILPFGVGVLSCVLKGNVSVKQLERCHVIMQLACDLARF